MTLKVRRLSNALGAEIQELDLTEPFSEDVCEELRRALLDYHVLLFRDQKLTPKQQIKFTHIFGEAEMNESVKYMRHPDYEEIVVVTNEGKEGKPSLSGDIGRQWHSDHSMTTRPTLASILHAHKIPEVGGDTMFANMYLAYDTLSDGLKTILNSLEAVHDSTQAGHMKNRTAEFIAEKRQVSPPVAHPVVRIHPETGRKALYVGEMMTSHFLGMTKEESRPLLQYLFAHSVRPEFTYRHQWHELDLLMWDNRCTMHNALADFDQSQTRTMFRSAVVGEPSGELVHDLSPAD